MLTWITFYLQHKIFSLQYRKYGNQIQNLIQKYSIFEIRIKNEIKFEHIRHFEYRSENSKNEYMKVFVCIRPSLVQTWTRVCIKFSVSQLFRIEVQVDEKFLILKIFQVPVRRHPSPGGWEVLCLNFLEVCIFKNLV